MKAEIRRIEKENNFEPFKLIIEVNTYEEAMDIFYRFRLTTMRMRQTEPDYIDTGIDGYVLNSIVEELQKQGFNV